jgi:hypothetical protein
MVRILYPATLIVYEGLASLASLVCVSNVADPGHAGAQCTVENCTVNVVCDWKYYQSKYVGKYHKGAITIVTFLQFFKNNF